MSSAEKQTRCPSVYVVIVYMQVCALGGSAFQRLFTLLRGKAKAGEKGLRCNNCESWWPSRAFVRDSGAKNIHGWLKLQLDCGPFSTATYKESLCHKPTQAEETWGERGEEKATEWASMWANKWMFTRENTHRSWRRLCTQLKFSLSYCRVMPPLSAADTDLWTPFEGGKATRDFSHCAEKGPFILLLYVPTMEIKLELIQWNASMQQRSSDRNICYLHSSTMP